MFKKGLLENKCKELGDKITIRSELKDRYKELRDKIIVKSERVYTYSGRPCTYLQLKTCLNKYNIE